MTPSPVRSRAASRRKYRRFLVNQPALVSCAAVPGLVWTARIADISRRGIQLILEHPARLDAEVRIQWTNREIRGTVRYQQERGGQYRVGVALSAPCDSLLVGLMARETAAPRKTDEEVAASAAQLRQEIREMSAALRAATQSSEIKSKLLASVSHEFRTPLNGIIGFSELLHDAKAGPVTTDQKEYLADILTCSRHLLTLINQVLDLTKIERGKMCFQYEPVELQALSREVMEGVRTLASRKRIAVRIDCDPRVGVVKADAARLRQVLFNYLSNAIKFTPEGGSVAVLIRPEDASCYRITVKDSGVGIRAEDIARLFTEFGQVGAGRAANPGTGLGLAITRQIVEAQGGRVGVESAPGLGSRFWAVLPVNPTA
jgi:signal transduction histidine kinase